MASRCFMPSEYARYRLPAAASRPTRSRAASVRAAAVRGLAVRSAASSRARLARPDSCGWKAGPSTSDPTRGSTAFAPPGMLTPSSRWPPLVGWIRPSSIRIVVVLPDPFGPRKP